jgi:putative serine protease PepD
VRSGAIVAEVAPGSPAARAGIRGGRQEARIGNYIVVVGGDVIVKMDETPVSEANDVLKKLRELSPGDRLRLEVVHANGRRDSVTVTLEENPPARRAR